MKKFIFLAAIIVMLASCGGQYTGPSPYTMTAKYQITVNGPYNAWNGGQKWIYYCDSYVYDGSEHYVLKKDSGEVVTDFTKRVGDRVEILPNPNRR